MSNVITRVKVRNKIYSADATNLDFTIRDHVIVQTEHGVELGAIHSNVFTRRNKKIQRKSLVKILRKSTQSDEKVYINNKEKALHIRNTIKEIIKQHNLHIKLIYIYYVLNCSKLFLYYISNNRIDFRLFVKYLGVFLKTKIQMVQIGVRDESKIIGGMGICGQVLCCKRFLHKFNTVTVNMIKDQHIFLNINKLSGFCDRLKCCISYEQHKNIP
jgi:cell fate regulator YaaT (PSP1 superfamily)